LDSDSKVMIIWSSSIAYDMHKSLYVKEKFYIGR